MDSKINIVSAQTLVGSHVEKIKNKCVRCN